MKTQKEIKEMIQNIKNKRKEVIIMEKEIATIEDKTKKFDKQIEKQEIEKEIQKIKIEIINNVEDYLKTL